MTRGLAHLSADTTHIAGLRGSQHDFPKYYLMSSEGEYATLRIIFAAS
jgi:hypothetical protein